MTNYGLSMATFEPYTAYLWRGADLGTAALCAIPFVILNALLYVWFTESMPRSGGDYVWITRIASPAIAIAGLGFLAFAGFTLVFAQIPGRYKSVMR